MPSSLKAAVAEAKKRERGHQTLFAIPRPPLPTHVVPGFAPSHPTWTQLLTGATDYNQDDYQAVGSSWLIEHPVGILGDMMGLGKCKMTLDAIHHVDTQIERVHSVLIVAKASNVDTWLDECAKFYPNYGVMAYRGTQRMASLESRERREYVEWKTELDQLPPSIIIMSHAIFVRDHESLKRLNWDWAIIDEAHAIKSTPLNGQQSLIAEYVHDIRAKRRHLLTGTPLINDGHDAWNLLRWLRIPELASWDYFYEKCLNVSEKYVGKFYGKNVYVDRINGLTAVGQAHIRTMLHKYMIRREKGDKSVKTPGMNIQRRKVVMNGAEAKAYRKVLKQYNFAVKHEGTENYNGPSSMVLQNRLRELSSSIHSKINEVKSLVEDAVESGQKVLVFTVHLDTLRMLYEALDPKYNVAYIHGGVTTSARDGERSDRQKMVNKLIRNPSCHVLIGMAQACREGLNGLTVASVIINCDKEWSPKYVDQLYGRADRIGQTQVVNVYELFSILPNGKQTVDGKFQRLLDRKDRVTDAIVEGRSMGSMRSRKLAQMLADDD